MKPSVFLVLLIVCASGFAQQIPLTVYAPRNGALFAGANSVYQDGEGWMWFTSTYDVVRYDGNVFKAIPLANGVEMEFCYGVFEAGEDIIVLAHPRLLRVEADSLKYFDGPEDVSDVVDQK